jgi:hypothetical protein
MDNAVAQTDALNSALADSAPEMAAAPSTQVQLICGVFNKELETWETNAVVRELNGYDEEALSSSGNSSTVYAEYMSFLLRRAVVSIGNVSIKDHPEVIDDLIIGDRDQLFLGIIKSTYGAVREYQIICNECGGSNDVFVNVDEFPVKEAQGDIRENIKVTLRNGKTVEFRLPNGKDSQVVAQKGKTTPEQNTIMLSRCVIGVDNASDWAKNLNMSDRSEIISTLLGAQPGPQIWEVKAQCAHCQEQMIVMLDWASLLFG